MRSQRGIARFIFFVRRIGAEEFAPLAAKSSMNKVAAYK